MASQEDVLTIVVSVGVHNGRVVAVTSMREENGIKEFSLVPLEQLQNMIEWVPIEEVKFFPKNANPEV